MPAKNRSAKVDGYIAKTQPFARPILMHSSRSGASSLPGSRRDHQVESTVFCISWCDFVQYGGFQSALQLSFLG